MNLRYGLRARFLASMALALLVVLALMLLLWSRQTRMQAEVEEPFADRAGADAVFLLTGGRGDELVHARSLVRDIVGVFQT